MLNASATKDTNWSMVNATKIVMLLRIPILLAIYNVDVKEGTLGTANFQFVFLIAL